MSVQHLTLYADEFRVPPVLHVVQNDTGRTVQFLIADYEVPAGAGAWLWMMIPGTETKVILAGTVSGQNVTVELTGAALAVDGKAPAMVQLTSGGKYVKTFGFYIDIQAQVGGEQVTPEEEELFEDLMAGVDQKFTGYEDEIDGTLEAFRAEFDEFIGAQGEHNETVLWTGTAYLVDAAITLDYIPDDYQEIKIYASGEWHSYKTSAFIDNVNGVTIKKSTLHSNGTPANFHHAELTLKAAYDHSDAGTTDEQKKAFTIYRHRVLAWSGDDAADASQTSVDQNFDTSQSDQVTLVEIRGVSNNANAEVADARVGYDGTEYASLGAAIRSQVAMAMASGISEDVKTALLNAFAHVAWVDEDGQDYYDALEDALSAKTLLSISAAFDQTGVTIYDTDTLDDLKQYLTVTANYDDGTTETVVGYTLSGTLTAGTSIITVTYNEKTTTFSVNVTAMYLTLSYIESDGNSYIDTGYVPTYQTSFEYDYMSLKNTGDAFQCPFGATSDTSTTANGVNYFFYFNTASNALVTSISKNSNTRTFTKTIAYGSRNTYVMSTADVTVDNVSLGAPYETPTSPWESSTSINGATLYAFARNQGNSANTRAFAVGRIYDLKIYENGSLVRHYVPRKRTTDNKYGLYDTEKGAFYYNGGSGTITGA